jgi:hypothetical protein
VTDEEVEAFMKIHTGAVPTPNPTTASTPLEEVFDGPVRCDDCGAEAVGIKALFATECTRPDDVSTTERRGHWLRIDCGRCRKPGNWCWLPKSWEEKARAGFMARCDDCVELEDDS